MKNFFISFMLVICLVFSASFVCLDSYADGPGIPITPPVICPMGCIAVEGKCIIDCDPGKFATFAPSSGGGMIGPRPMTCGDCPTGYYCPGGTLDCNSGAGKIACDGDSEYQDETGQASCKQCPVATNQALLSNPENIVPDIYYVYNKEICLDSPDDIHDTVEGCAVDCQYNGFVSGVIDHGKVIGELAACYVNNTVNDYVGTTIIGYYPAYPPPLYMPICDAGYYANIPPQDRDIDQRGAIFFDNFSDAVEGTCLPCPENTYFDGSSLLASCPSNMTCGAMDDSVCQPCPSDRPFSSAGSDELSDCGHILHYGDHKVYLRSEIKTNPSFRSLIGGAQFYGNMKCTDQSPSGWTFPGNNVPPRPHAWVNVNGQTCLIYDDSAEF